MRLPIPERFSTRAAVIFVLLLFLGQQIAGTDIAFSLLTALYVVLFVIGFNLGGGLLYPSGAFIFFNGVLTAIFGLTYKVFRMEPGEKYLFSGDKSMLVYCGGMFSMVVAVALNRKLRPKRGLLGGIASGKAVKHAAIGFLVVGAVIESLTWKTTEGSFASAFQQINHFIPMAIVLAVIHEIQRSNGRRSTNWVVYAGGLLMLSEGLLRFSKEGMFTGPVTWLVTVIAMGYNFTRRQIVVCGLGAFLMMYYLVPYSQYVRNYNTGTTSGNFTTAVQFLGNLGETRSLYLSTLEEHDTTGEPHLYGTPQGFFDRLNMFAFDDALINYTDQGNVFGLLPTYSSYINIVPHFIWKDKPAFLFGNVFGREIGVIPDEDETTGISFSPTGDAYHEATWFGVLVVWPMVAFLFFFLTDSLTGSAREAPWALLPIILVSHQAPEGTMSGTIFLSTYGIVALLALVGFAKYLLPLLSSIIPGARQTAPSLGNNLPVRRI